MTTLHLDESTYRRVVDVVRLMSCKYLPESLSLVE